MEPNTTKRAASPTELVLVDSLLTFTYRRMAGALDLGLVMLQEAPIGRYAQYVADHIAAPMRAAALLLRVTMAEAVPAPALSPLEAIAVDTEIFVGALTDFARVAELSDTELRALADKLGQSFRRLRNSLLDVAERLAFQPTMLTTATPEREAFYENILDRLYADLSSDGGAGGAGSAPRA